MLIVRYLLTRLIRIGEISEQDEFKSAVRYREGRRTSGFSESS